LYRVIEKRSQEKNDRIVACGVVPKSQGNETSQEKNVYRRRRRNFQLVVRENQTCFLNGSLALQLHRGLIQQPDEFGSFIPWFSPRIYNDGCEIFAGA
jgi:hypothetical protein